MHSNVSVWQQSMQDVDKNQLFVCPYDPVHRISGKRFVPHILKCRKNHPGADMATCPFNARHIMKKPELQSHICGCPDRVLLEQEINYERTKRNGALKGDTSVPEYSTEELDFGGEYESWDQEVAEEENAERKGKYRHDNVRHKYAQILEHRREQKLRQQQEMKMYYPDGDNAHDRPPVAPWGPPVLESKIPTTKPRMTIGMGRGRGRIGNLPLEPQSAPKQLPSLAANFPTINNLNSSMERPPLHRAVDEQTTKRRDMRAINEKVQKLKAQKEEEQRKSEKIEAFGKEKKKYLKILKQIETLEISKDGGKSLDNDQEEKLARKGSIQSRLQEISSELDNLQ